MLVLGLVLRLVIVPNVNIRNKRKDFLYPITDSRVAGCGLRINLLKEKKNQQKYGAEDKHTFNLFSSIP